MPGPSSNTNPGDPSGVLSYAPRGRRLRYLGVRPGNGLAGVLIVSPRATPHPARHSLRYSLSDKRADVRMESASYILFGHL